MGTRWFALACVVAVLGAASPACAATFPLEYRLKAEKEMPRSPTWLTATPQKPEGIKADPAYKAKPLYARFPFGVGGQKKPFVLVLDKSSADPPGYNVVYIDRDRDGDVREEQPTRVNQSYQAELELPVAAGGKFVAYRFWAKLAAPTSGAPAVIISHKGTWGGKVSLAGTPMDILLFDRNDDGVYNEPWTVREGRFQRPGDMLFTESPKGLALPYSAPHLCPAIIEAGGTLYNVTVAADGSSISFEPLKGPFGTVETPADGMTVSLHTANGRHQKATAKGRRIRAPVGEARAFFYNLKQASADGTEWWVTAWTRDMHKLAVEEGKTTRLPVGPPLQLSVRCEPGKKVEAGKEVRLRPALRDTAGWYVEIAHTREKTQRRPDASLVLKQGDRVIAQAKCKPG